MFAAYGGNTKRNPRFIAARQRQERSQKMALDIRRRVEEEREEAKRRKTEEVRERIRLLYQEVLTPNHPDGRQRCDAIIRRVAAEHQVRVGDIKGEARNRDIVAARFAAIYEVKLRRPDLSLTQIGNLFGGRDHTSILHALKKMGYYDKA